MSIEAVARTLPAPLGGSGKLVLVGLANHAHPDGSQAYPAVPTLASYAYCDPRTVQRNLRALEARRWVERTGVMPDGRVIYRLRFEVWEEELKRAETPVEGDNLPPRQIAAPPATMPGAPPASLPPKPSFNRPPSMESPGSRATEDDRDLQLEELAEHVRGVLQRGIDGITSDEVGRLPGRGEVLAAMRAHPELSADDLLAAGIEARSITQAHNRAPNVVGLYRQRLDRRSAEIAASAPVPSAGAP